MRKTYSNPRRNFLKKITVAIVSMSALAFFSIKKHINYSEKKFDTLSKSEADEIINSSKFATSVHIKPAPAPLGPKNING